jgi:hypothetical protein
MTHLLWHIDAVSGGGVHPIDSGLSRPPPNFQRGDVLCFPERPGWPSAVLTRPAFEQATPLNRHYLKQMGPVIKEVQMSGFSNELRTAQRTVRASILAALVLVGLGINDFVTVHVNSFGHGISGMLREFLYTYFGAPGLFALWIVLALVPLWFARLIWRHTPRAPSDRWYRN